MTTYIPKTTIQRLVSDIKTIQQNPLVENGIHYKHDEEDLLKGYALIVGPSDTPYFSGFYFFQIIYPRDYPYSPPRVIFDTNNGLIRFNPNLYTCGKVCVSLLNTWQGDQWTSCQTISSILLTICTILCKTPLLNEPGVSITHRDVDKYTNVIEYSNISVAICDILNKNVLVYKPYFVHFYEIYIDIFKQNYKQLEDYVNEKSKQQKDNTCKISVQIYHMKNISIDYNTLLKKIKSCYEFIQNDSLISSNNNNNNN